MNKKTKTITRIICLILAAAMLATLAYTLFASIFLG